MTNSTPEKLQNKPVPVARPTEPAPVRLFKEPSAFGQKAVDENGKSLDWL